MMLSENSAGDAKPDTVAMERISHALHDLCQPLTTLQCRLEIAQLSRSLEDYRDAVQMGLVECERLIDGVGRMREIVRATSSAREARTPR